MKLIKNKIFLVITTLLIGISGTLYAASIYYATDVIYSPSTGENISVNDALNDLYKKSNNKSTVSIYYLGNGTTFDIKTLLPDIDYTQLTVDNFIVKINETKISFKQIQTQQQTDTNIVRHKTYEANFTKTYVDGVFSITSSTIVGETLVYNTDYGGYWRPTGSVSYQACGGVYLVIGDITDLTL